MLSPSKRLSMSQDFTLVVLYNLIDIIQSYYWVIAYLSKYRYCNNHRDRNIRTVLYPILISVRLCYVQYSSTSLTRRLIGTGFIVIILFCS